MHHLRKDAGPFPARIYVTQLEITRESEFISVLANPAMRAGLQMVQCILFHLILSVGTTYA